MEQLISFALELLHMGNIPCRVVTLPLEEADWLDLGLRKKLFGAGHLAERVNARLKREETPLLLSHSDRYRLHYVALSLPEAGSWLFCGPMLSEPVTEERLRQIAAGLELPAESIPVLREFYGSLRRPDWEGQTDAIFPMLADRLYGRENYRISDEDEEEQSEDLQVYRGYLQVTGEPLLGVDVVEHRYELENTLMRAVSHGNERQALDTVTELYAQPHPPVRLRDSLRDGKDLMISLNTLLRKAAESAGVHPIHIDGYSNHTVQLLESLVDVSDTASFARKIVRGYCRLVQRFTLKDHSPLVRKVITYVSADLRADLTLNALATRLSVSPSYLSSLFKKEMGVSLTDYVNGCRIEHAKTLLLWSNLPVKQVAISCGVEDIYYFSRMFKKTVGRTPKTWQQEERGKLRES